jgi:hypothetical protein
VSGFHSPKLAQQFSFRYILFNHNCEGRQERTVRTDIDNSSRPVTNNSQVAVRLAHLRSHQSFHRQSRPPPHHPVGPLEARQAGRPQRRLRSRLRPGPVREAAVVAGHSHGWRRVALRRWIACGDWRSIRTRDFVYDLNVGHICRRTLHCLRIEIPGASYIPPPTVTPVPHFVMPASTFPGEAAVIGVSTEIVRRQRAPRETSIPWPSAWRQPRADRLDSGPPWCRL